MASGGFPTHHFQHRWIWTLSFVVCSVIFVRAVIERPVSSDLTAVMREGQRQYELIQEKSNLPDSGQCWRNAVARLHNGCRHLTESLQIELALRFADCFMQSSGHSGIECLADNSEGDTVTQQACLRNLTDRVFLTYTEFYTHSQSMCLFLMSQVWHHETQKTIDKLWTSASDVSKRLEEAGKIQESLLDGQKESMNLQQTLLDNSHQLGNLVHESASTLSVVFKEFRTTAAEQQQLLGQVFHHLSALQSWIVGEVSWVDSLVFYICATFFAYLVTSPRRVADARFPLFIVLLISATAERLLASYVLAENSDPESIVLISTLKEQLYWWLWILRRVSLITCVGVLSVAFYRYADQEQQRHQLLLQICSQNKEMITFLQNKLSNQGLTNSRDVTDFIGYSAIKVNPGTPSTPKVNTFEASEVATIQSDCSPSPRHFFDYTRAKTPTLESVLSQLPVPPADPPEEKAVEALEKTSSLEVRANSKENSPFKNSSSFELRTSSKENTFYSFPREGSVSSINSEDISGKIVGTKTRTKSPSRRKKSPGRSPVPVSQLNDVVKSSNRRCLDDFSVELTSIQRRFDRQFSLDSVNTLQPSSSQLGTKFGGVTTAEVCDIM